MPLAVAFVVALALALALTPLGIRTAWAVGYLDHPEARKLHIAATPRVTVAPRIAGTAHIILAVEDVGSPALTSYRRVILTLKAK